MRDDLGTDWNPFLRAPNSVSRLCSQLNDYITDYSFHLPLLPTIKVSNSRKGIACRRKELWVEDGRLGGESSTAGPFVTITEFERHRPTSPTGDNRNTPR
jgi:hypothetical protein